MAFDRAVMIVIGLAICFMSGAESMPCPSGTVAVNITSTADVRNLTDVLACTGGGSFDITLYSSVIIAQRIEVANMKSVSVTGAGFPSIRGAPADDDGAAGAIGNDGSGHGIFHVANGSTLRLNNLVLEGGNAEDGGAVNLVASSSLFVLDCTFTNNNASNGGEPTCLRYDLHRGGDHHLVKHFKPPGRTPQHDSSQSCAVATGHSILISHIVLLVRIPD